MKTRTRLLAGAVVLLAVMVTLAVATAWHWWSSPGPATTQTLVEIPRGDGPNRISQRLAAARVLEHPRWFAWAVRFSGHAQNLKAGEYAFTPGQSPAAVFAQLVAGQVTRYSVTFIEGQTAAEAWQRVRSSP